MQVRILPGAPAFAASRLRPASQSRVAKAARRSPKGEVGLIQEFLAFVAQLEEQLPGTQQAACSIHAEGTSLRRFAASAGKPVANCEGCPSKPEGRSRANSKRASSPTGRRRLSQKEHSAGSNPAWRTSLRRFAASAGKPIALSEGCPTKPERRRRAIAVFETTNQRGPCSRAISE